MSTGAAVMAFHVQQPMNQEAIEHIVQVWQQRLRLTHWDIQVRWGLPVDKSCDAEIKISDDYEQASIRIQTIDDPDTEPPTEHFSKWTPEQANRIIVHELLHIYEKQTKRPLEQFMPEKPTPAHDLLWAWYEHGAENWVDRLAMIFVDLVGVVE